MSEAAEITQMLVDARAGDRAASDRLLGAVYEKLRGMAHGMFASERPDHTLQPTALVHEAWLRIFSHGGEPGFNDRAHFYAVAGRQMRRLLIDHGRQFRSPGRGGGLKVALDDNIHSFGSPVCEFEDVNDLLNRLQRADPEAAQVVELKFFSGMTDQEVAAELKCSHSTVRRHWKFAQAWLVSHMNSPRAEAAAQSRE
jgi:RNA polymerase sigma factor (TIGR02999 family)